MQYRSLFKPGVVKLEGVKGSSDRRGQLATVVVVVVGTWPRW